MHKKMYSMTQNEKSDIKSLTKMFKYIKPYLIPIIFTIVFSVLSAITTIIGPEKISDLISLISSSLLSNMQIDIKEVVKISTELIILYVLGALLMFASNYITVTITQYLSRKMREDVSKKLNCLPLNFYDNSTKGNILSIVTNDVDVISQSLSSNVASLVSAITLFFGVTIKMFITNGILSLIVIITSILGFFVMGFIMKASQKYFNRKQMDLGEMNGDIEEVYSNLKIVNIFNAKKQEEERFQRINNRLYEDNWKSQIISGCMMHVMTFVGNLVYVLIFVIGVTFILNNQFNVSIAVIMQFVIYARLFSQPLSTFAQSMSSFQQASAASKRLVKILEEKELDNEDNKIKQLTKVEGNIEFKNIHFGYFTNKIIIKDFSIKIEKGQKVAIVGPTGAGKTTIVNLLMRFYETISGDILIDGTSIYDIKRENVHDLFDMILQDTWLFNGTIRENLVFNKKDVSEEVLDKVCKAVGLEHFIKSLKESYDTIIDDKLNLSEGQKQQITIARAMIKDAPLLILDEATSSIDTRTELIIQNAMDKLTKGRTSFVIAHRLSTIKNADLILVLKDGDIIETGNHESLLEKKGFYFDLYNSQFEKA